MRLRHSKNNNYIQILILYRTCNILWNLFKLYCQTKYCKDIVMLNMYIKLLHKHPLITRSVTCGILFAISDSITQNFVEKKQKFDWKRNLSLGLLATYYSGPLTHLWYAHVSPRLISYTLAQNASKYTKAIVGMIFNQIIFTPIFFPILYTLAALQNDPSINGFNKGIKDCKQKLKDTIINNWKVWPIATVINLLYVPFMYQVLFANFTALFWNIYVSYMVNK